MTIRALKTEQQLDQTDMVEALEHLVKEAREGCFKTIVVCTIPHDIDKPASVFEIGDFTFAEIIEALDTMRFRQHARRFGLLGD